MGKALVAFGYSLLVISASIRFFWTAMEDRIYDWKFARLLVASLLLFATFTAFAVILKSIAEIVIRIVKKKELRSRSILRKVPMSAF